MGLWRIRRKILIPRPTQQFDDPKDKNLINQSTWQKLSTPEDHGNFCFPENPPFVGAEGEFDPFAPTPENPSEPKLLTGNLKCSGNDGLASTHQPSENQISICWDTQEDEHLPRAQWTSTKDSLSSWQTDQAALRRDMNYLTGRLHHYYVPSDTEATVTLSLLKWNEINGNFVVIRKTWNRSKIPRRCQRWWICL